MISPSHGYFIITAHIGAAIDNSDAAVKFNFPIQHGSMEITMRRLLLLLIFTLSFIPNVLFSEEKSETAPVSLYKPNYITIDPEDLDLKFQLSYRIRLYEFSKSWSVFISHTHKAYWAITTEESAPFREHNFNPEIHFRWKNPESSLFLKHVQIGFEHESTGVAGSESRSWNRLTGQVEWTYFSEDHSTPGHVHAYLRGWKIVDKDDDNNQDIKDHLGPGEIRISYVLHKAPNILAQSEVAITMRIHSIMFEYGFNAPGPDFLWYIQYWNGRGEWLVGYNEDTSILRAGIKFSVH